MMTTRITAAATIAAKPARGAQGNQHAAGTAGRLPQAIGLRRTKRCRQVEPGALLQLLRRLIAEAEARGYRQMIAVIGDSANAGSIGVHTRCGFQMIGTHPNVGFKFGRWLDTVMMQRALGEGAMTLPPSQDL